MGIDDFRKKIVVWEKNYCHCADTVIEQLHTKNEILPKK
jgi:hypothetical protein